MQAHPTVVDCGTCGESIELPTELVRGESHSGGYTQFDVYLDMDPLNEHECWRLGVV